MTTPSLHVRELVQSDRAEWLRLLAGLYPQHLQSDHVPAVDAFLAGLPHNELLPSVVFVSAKQQGGLSGFLELSIRNYAEGCAGATPYVEGWFVDPDARGLGVGQSLMRAAEFWARERGYTEIASDTQLDNDESLHAHRALGFEVVERTIHFRKTLS